MHRPQYYPPPSDEETMAAQTYERTFPPRPPADDAPAVVAVDPAPNSPSDAGGM